MSTYMAPVIVDVAMDMKETVSTLAQVNTAKFHITEVFYGNMDCKMNILIISLATFFECNWSPGGSARAPLTVFPLPVNMIFPSVEEIITRLINAKQFFQTILLNNF